VGIPDAVADLDRAVAEFLARGDDDNAKVLAAIFTLNNEIGRRLRPTGDEALRTLQLCVNDVTAAAKMVNGRRLSTAMAKVRVSSSALSP